MGSYKEAALGLLLWCLIYAGVVGGVTLLTGHHPVGACADTVNC